MGARALVVGAGDTGTRIVRGGLQRGWHATGLVRSAAGAERVGAAGGEPLQADLDAPLPPLPAADLIFYCAPPPRTGDDDPRLAQVLATYPPNSLQRLIYISTSGVYGDCQGAWVDETRAPDPGTDRARRRLAAENRIAAWGGDYATLRTPGIYGPGRLPVERVRAAEPILSDEAGPWTNRIHVADLADIALAAAEAGPARSIYNASDGHPLPMGAYYRLLAEKLGCAPPPEIDWETAQQQFSAARLSFLRESRRLDNQRLRQYLDITLRYRDIESGLEASLSES